MAFLTFDDFQIKLIRNRAVDVATNPQPVRKGTLVLSSDLSKLSVVQIGGHLGADDFEVQYTAGSNLVVIPNNIMVWTGLKLYCPQFPTGVTITGKTANFREYTIASNATVTRKEFSNFCYLRTYRSFDFGGYNTRNAPTSDMNTIRNEGSYYVTSATSNIPETGTGHFLDVMQNGLFIMQISRANNNGQRVYHRRSSDAGVTWSAWFEVLTSNLTWVAATLQNGFTNVSGRPVQYALCGNQLHVRGGVNTPSGTAPSDATIFIVPTAYYPSQEKFLTVYGAGTGATSFPTMRARLQTDGAFINSFAATVQIIQVDCIVGLK